ncbi:MAG: hypothetical protein P8X50_15375 [Maritimibacter sp.]
MRRIILALALTLPALPGRAEDTPACWQPGMAPSLFDWQQTPSLACRDGALAGAPVTLTKDHPRPNQSADNTPPDPAPLFEFGGSVYFGVAMTIKH